RQMRCVAREASLAFLALSRYSSTHKCVRKNKCLASQSSHPQRLPLTMLLPPLNNIIPKLTLTSSGGRIHLGLKPTKSKNVVLVFPIFPTHLQWPISSPSSEWTP